MAGGETPEHNLPRDWMVFSATIVIYLMVESIYRDRAIEDWSITLAVQGMC